MSRIVKSVLARHGFERRFSTPAELDAHNREQLKAWQRAVREAKIPVD